MLTNSLAVRQGKSISARNTERADTAVENRFCRASHLA
jgi:hypothetical protein